MSSLKIPFYIEAHAAIFKIIFISFALPFVFYLIRPYFLSLNSIDLDYLLIILSLFFIFSVILTYGFYKKWDLGRYIKNQRDKLLNLNASGSLILKIKDIVNEDLFIDPNWVHYNDKEQETEIIPFLISSLENNNSVLILGEAGQGKTMITYKLYHELVQLYDCGKLKKLPLFVPLSKFKNYDPTRSQKGIYDILYDHLEKNVDLSIPINKDGFISLIKQEKIIFLLDGYDEFFDRIDLGEINTKAENELFHQLSVLTCRVNFYKNYLITSQVINSYNEKIEILPLETKAIEQYISKYYIRNYQNSDHSTPNDYIKSILASLHSSGLMDLAKRPLLLMMILEVFPDPSTINSSSGEKIHYNITQLYQAYTKKWLEEESRKSYSKLYWEEKDRILEEIAWEHYITNVPFSTSYGSIKDQTSNFGKQQIKDILKKYTEDHTDLSLDQITNDICLRSFLVSDDNDNFSFIHKSFFEYYVAKCIFTNLKKDWNNTKKSLNHSTPDEIASFLQNFLRDATLSKSDRSRIENNLKSAYNKSMGKDLNNQIIREYACYYLSCLKSPSAITFLRDKYPKEKCRLTQRGMMIGIIVNYNDKKVLNDYLVIVATDPKAAHINLAYSMAYYGDIPHELINNSLKDYSCQNTIHNLIKHLCNEKYKLLWAIDLFTLRQIVQIHGISELEINSDNYNTLESILEKELNNSQSDEHYEEQRDLLLKLL